MSAMGRHSRGLTLRPVLPVSPVKRTIFEPLGGSQTGHSRTHAPQQGGSIGSPRRRERAAQQLVQCQALSQF